MQNRKDDVPNQELAREIAESKDSKAIKEIVENLWNKNRSIQSDCIKVLYEIGYIDSRLIQQYVDDFLRLLSSKNKGRDRAQSISEIISKMSTKTLLESKQLKIRGLED